MGQHCGKVLFLVNHDITIYNTRRELVETILSLGYEVYISSPYGERIKILQDMGCHYIPAEFDRHSVNPISELKLIQYYRKTVKQINPDLVLTFTIKPNIYGGFAASALHIPYIVNITGLGTALEKPGILQKINVFLYRIAMKSVHRIFVQNSDNYNFLEEKKIASDKLRLIPGSGVNLEYFSVQHYPDGNTIEFAFISRIMKEKGINEFLDAAQYIKEKYPNTVFHVCGFCEEAYHQTLQDLDEKGIIQYHGLVHDIREILKRVHCVVHPSYYPEGLSNTLLESCACGRPIITTDRSGCKEVIEDTVNGFMIGQKDSQSLKEALERFIRLPQTQREQMGLSGRKKVEKEFDRNFVVQAYVDEINQIMKN